MLWIHVAAFYRRLKLTFAWGRNRPTLQEYYEDIEGRTATLPGILIMYEPWPTRVTKKVSRLGFLHLLVRLCAVIGGLWTVCGILNRSVHAVVVKIARGLRRNNSKGIRVM